MHGRSVSQERLARVCCACVRVGWCQGCGMGDISTACATRPSPRCLSLPLHTPHQPRARACQPQPVPPSLHLAARPHMRGWYGACVCMSGSSQPRSCVPRPPLATSDKTYSRLRDPTKPYRKGIPLCLSSGLTSRCLQLGASICAPAHSHRAFVQHSHPPQRITEPSLSVWQRRSLAATCYVIRVTCKHFGHFTAEASRATRKVEAHWWQRTSTVPPALDFSPPHISHWRLSWGLR